MNRLRLLLLYGFVIALLSGSMMGCSDGVPSSTGGTGGIGGIGGIGGTAGTGGTGGTGGTAGTGGMGGGGTCNVADCPAPSSECLDAVCKPDGTCGEAPKADGKQCDDGDACTQTDTCQAGACTGAGPMMCPVLHVCTAGACIDDPIAYVKASNTNDSDHFGYSIALSANGNTMAVGAYEESSNATGVGGNQADNSESSAGAVYVFTRSGGMWSQQAYVKASNTNFLDRFGVSLGLSADGNTLAVGAEGESSNATGVGGNQADNSASYAGAVYVFTRSGGVWTQQAYVKASNTDSSDAFGSSVALSGDGNTLAVGASEERSNATGVNGNQADNSANGAGAVYVFTRSGGMWSQQAYIKASNTQLGDNFGSDLALSGDGSTLAVGAYLEDSNATGVGGNQADNSASQSGAVYVYSRSGGVWSQQAYVKASNTEAVDRFGSSLALSGDGNTLVAGASLEDSNAIGLGGNQADNSALEAGAVYVFTRSGGMWSQQAYLKASNTQASDNFGNGVMLSADGNILAVAADEEDSNATGLGGNQADNSVSNAGAVYMFMRSGGLWSQLAYIKASTTEPDDRFGFRVALSADGSTLAVNAFGEDSNATGINGNQADNSASFAGAVYVY